MEVEIDHIFICVSLGAEEEANCLTAFGLAEGTPNVHPGQGTACRRFFLANCYLELLWVSNAEEAQSESTKPVGLWERWERRAGGVRPFGLGLRPRIQHNENVPFSNWEYHPSYLPAPLKIYVATNAHVPTEPMLFHLPFALRPDRYPSAQRPPFDHCPDLREITRVEFLSPNAGRFSPEMAAVAAVGVAQWRAGSEHLVELVFDGESQDQQADFRPLLPLRFCW